MNAEDDCAGGGIEQPGPYNVANTGLGGIIIVPLIAPQDSLGNTLGKLNPIPARGGFEQWPIRVCAVTRRRFPVGASPTRRFAPAGSNRSRHGGDRASRHLVARISWAERLGLGSVEDHFPFGRRNSQVAGLGCSPPKPLRAANLAEQ